MPSRFLSWLLSLGTTALVAAVLGVVSALPTSPPGPSSPVVGAQLRLAGEARAGNSADLLLSLTNYGPGDADAPLEGVLSLEVLRLEPGEDMPLTMVATSVTSQPGTGPLTLGTGETVHAVVPLARLGVLDEPGLYRLRGEVIGPAGIMLVGPITVEVLEPVAVADGSLHGGRSVR